MNPQPPISDAAANEPVAGRRAEPASAGSPAQTSGRLPEVPAAARHLPFAVLSLITGVIAWIASFALVLERLAMFKNPDYVPSCDLNPWVSCGSVMKSDQAALFGFPNPLIGLAAFAVVITTAMAVFAGARLARWYWLGMQVGVTLGIIFITWLWSQSLYAIGILCPYCIIVWAMMIPLFVWTSIRNISHGVIKLPAAPTRILGAYGWHIVVLLYVGVAASIFFRFMSMFVG